MSKIRILPEQLANQIAAGEVVERPASVVKELIENSLDAGARHITIEVSGSGTSLIRVVDDGEGMDADDLLLCLERHGTSKIQGTSSLAAINSLGFRGEALPSIASVAKLRITSRLADQPTGATVNCEYGVIKTAHECGAPVGTTMEVAALFGNTPARRKFLRSSRTEQAHIDETVKLYALAYPEVAFTLRVGDRVAVEMAHDMNRTERLKRIIRQVDTFIAVNNNRSDIAVTGLLAPPEHTLGGAGKLRLFVNGRAVRDRLLTHAVYEGMATFVQKNQSLAGMLEVTLPADQVDVNVHPAKLEVRFRDSRTVHQRVVYAVKEAMLGHQQHLRADLFSSHHSSPVPADTGYGYSAQVPEYTGSTEMTAETGPSYQGSRAGLAQRRFDHDPLTGQHPPLAHDTPAAPLTVEDLLIIGCFKDLYIICRAGDSLIIIDQHAAQERLIFEKLKAQFEAGRVVCQTLLFPIQIELTPLQSQLVEANMATLANLGFSVREFGDTTWILAGVPALAKTIEPQSLFFDVLQRFGSDTEHHGTHLLDDMLASMACKAAIKKGDHLSGDEISALLHQMAKADLFSHCPHGRPVVKRIEESDIKKWFSRS
jgi:DNA mismatch repair protein MutL